jgi:hypothetical protein
VLLRFGRRVFDLVSFFVTVENVEAHLGAHDDLVLAQEAALQRADGFILIEQQINLGADREAWENCEAELVLLDIGKESPGGILLCGTEKETIGTMRF